MSHDVLESLPRHERKRLLRAEAAARKSGDWGPWETLPFPAGIGGRGWTNEVRLAHRNAVFSVLVRYVRGGVVHLAVSSLTQVRPTWPEMQRIKDELAGSDATAVEVYPPQSEIIDEADMYHIWVLPGPLWFSLDPVADRRMARMPVPPAEVPAP
jgi:hypothetical protein